MRVKESNPFTEIDTHSLDITIMFQGQSDFSIYILADVVCILLRFKVS